MSDRVEGTAVVSDQYPLCRDAICAVITHVGLEVVGAARSGAEALALVSRHRPDLLVTDVALGENDLEGLALVRRGLEEVPSLRTIVLSIHNDRVHVEAAISAGALAYVVKTAEADDLAWAIRQAFGRSVYLYDETTTAPLTREVAADDLPTLTRREIEILQLVAEGHANAHVARMLWVTEQTVKFHLSNIYRKLDVANRTEASRWAQRHGLLATPTLGVSD